MKCGGLSDGVSVGKGNDAGAIVVEKVCEIEVRREVNGGRVFEGFRVRERSEEMIDVRERTRRGRAAEVVEEEGRWWDEMVGIEKAGDEIGG